MMLPVTISKLSGQLGLTSRTLRHWESEGLFTSMRDRESGWRVYDEDAVLCIKITSILRRLDIPLKDIRTVLKVRTPEVIESAVKKQLLQLDRTAEELLKQRSLLNRLLDSLSKVGDSQTGSTLAKLSEFVQASFAQSKCEKVEDIEMVNNETTDNRLRFITLPPMRTVYNIAVSASPEDEATVPVAEWLKAAGLAGTARLFGGDVKPFPSKERPEYGYGMCASIPEGVEIPPHLKEMRLPGGLYAMLPSSEDIYGSWQLLMKLLSENSEYASDRSRLCLEEHIRNDNPEGQGNQYTLNLLEPVRRK